jgi:hypothetical protein
VSGVAKAPLADPAVAMRVRLRKPHACGGDTFTVAELGADIRLYCDRCRRKVFIDRARWKTRVREVIAGGPG